MRSLTVAWVDRAAIWDKIMLNLAAVIFSPGVAYPFFSRKLRANSGSRFRQSAL
jgi:hypothetical protein